MKLISIVETEKRDEAEYLVFEEIDFVDDVVLENVFERRFGRSPASILRKDGSALVGPIEMEVK